MKKYLGLISILIIILGVSACFIVFPDIVNRTDFTFSDFGVISQTTWIFNLTLIFGGIVNLIYSDYLRGIVKLKRTHIISIFLYISSLSLIGIGFFPYNLNSALHDLFAGVVFDVFPLTLFFLARLFNNQRGKLIQFFCIASIILEAIVFQFVLPRAIGEGVSVLFTFLIYVVLSDM